MLNYYVPCFVVVLANCRHIVPLLNASLFVCFRQFAESDYTHSSGNVGFRQPLQFISEHDQTIGTKGSGNLRCHFLVGVCTSRECLHIQVRTSSIYLVSSGAIFVVSIAPRAVRCERLTIITITNAKAMRIAVQVCPVL